MPHCNSDAPASPQPSSRYSYPLMLAVLMALSGALVLSTASLLSRPATPCAAVDANGNCVKPVSR